MLEACRVTRDVAVRRAHVGLPARAGLRATAGVEADAGDDHVGVAGLAVDRHPLARSGLAERLQSRRVARDGQQVRAVQRVGDRARAVIAGVVERSVAAAVLVRLVAISLPAAMIAYDRGGAPAGAVAVPSVLIVAVGPGLAPSTAVDAGTAQVEAAVLDTSRRRLMLSPRTSPSTLHSARFWKRRTRPEGAACRTRRRQRS